MNIVMPHLFSPRHYQLPVFQALQNGVRRINLRWHRRAGKDLTAIHICAMMGVLEPGTYWHVLPTYAQGKKVVWEGKTKEGVPFLDAIPEQIRIGNPNQTEMKIKFQSAPNLVTGRSMASTYQVVGGDNYDSLVGSNPKGIVFSEWSLTDPRAWDYFRPILAENEGWAVFIYTPRGKNHAYSQESRIKDDPAWFNSILTVDDTGAVAPERIQQDRKEGYSEEKIQSEYYVSYESATDGAVYKDEIRFLEENNRFDSGIEWDPRYQVSTCWDIGMDDLTFLWFFQEIDRKIFWIDCYYSSGHGITHYAKKMGEKPYVYGRHFGPWDIEVRNFGAEATTRKEIFRQNGIRMIPAKKQGREDGIEAVRSILKRSYFNIQKCQYGVDSIKAYTRKETDNEYVDVTGKRTRVFGEPEHNWASHACDALRSFATGRKGIDSGDSADIMKAIQDERNLTMNYNPLEY